MISYRSLLTCESFFLSLTTKFHWFAMFSVLMSRLYDMENEKREMEERARRGSQVGTGGRSEKIRTYNWKDSRCSDHRIGQNYPLAQFLGGDLEPMISTMIMKDQEEKLKELSEESQAA